MNGNVKNAQAFNHIVFALICFSEIAVYGFSFINNYHCTFFEKCITTANDINKPMLPSNRE